MPLILILLISCLKPEKEKNLPKDFIKVSYINGFIDSNLSFNCNDEILGKSHITKEVVISKKDFNIIVELINGIQLTDTIKNESCDKRMDIRFDSINICIGAFDCIKKEGNSASANDSLLYLIRSNTGYYNFFSKNDLENFFEIKKWGVPKNYTYEEIDENKIPIDSIIPISTLVYIKYR